MWKGPQTPEAWGLALMLRYIPRPTVSNLCGCHCPLSFDNGGSAQERTGDDDENPRVGRVIRVQKFELIVRRVEPTRPPHRRSYRAALGAPGMIAVTIRRSYSIAVLRHSEVSGLWVNVK